MTPGFRPGKILRIFIDEGDRTGMQPTYTAIVEFLRGRGVSGTTVLRGIEGYGAHARVHEAKVFALVSNLPVVIEVVETAEVLDPLLPELERMVGEGLLTVGALEFMRRERGGTSEGAG